LLILLAFFEQIQEGLPWGMRLECVAAWTPPSYAWWQILVFCCPCYCCCCQLLVVMLLGFCSPWSTAYCHLKLKQMALKHRMFLTS
jgi:hypothetical protein